MILKNINLYLSMLAMLFVLSCSNSKPSKTSLETENYPKFDVSKSDPNAIEIADKVMEAMGGQRSWDATRFITWDFFGARKLWWDKLTGNVRIESQRDKYTVLVNINDTTGKVMKDGEILSHPDSLSKYLKMGKSIWINDAYWLVMPFKLKDSGVTLKYVKQDTTSEGQMADVLAMTFDSVGDTPENKYEVYVDQQTNLVTEWAFYKNANDEKPQFKTPWKHYKKHGNILLSSNRGKGYLLSDIEVSEEMPPAIFTEF